MSNILVELFNNELGSIQSRHALFFPEEQKRYIRFRQQDVGFQLQFLDNYDLPSVITLEIELAFKLMTNMSPSSS